MGLTLNVTVFILTIVVTLSTTALMCISILTDYWETVTYPLTNIEKVLNASSSLENNMVGDKEDDVYTVETSYKGKVIFVQNAEGIKEIMIEMHAGLWAICYDLTGSFHFKVGFVFLLFLNLFTK